MFTINPNKSKLWLVNNKIKSRHRSGGSVISTIWGIAKKVLPGLVSPIIGPIFRAITTPKQVTVPLQPLNQANTFAPVENANRPRAKRPWPDAITSVPKLPKLPPRDPSGSGVLSKKGRNILKQLSKGSGLLRM